MEWTAQFVVVPVSRLIIKTFSPFDWYNTTCIYFFSRQNHVSAHEISNSKPGVYVRPSGKKPRSLELWVYLFPRLITYNILVCTHTHTIISFTSSSVRFPLFSEKSCNNNHQYTRWLRLKRVCVIFLLSVRLLPRPVTRPSRYYSVITRS